MVDYVVKATDPSLHLQSYAAAFRPELSGQLRYPAGAVAPMPLDNRKVIARRGAMELKPDCLINLGIGVPSGVGSVANEEGFGHRVTLSLESGPQGGIPVEGVGFGASVNAQAIYNMADMFDMYDGGILDMTFLGAAEIDSQGNVNVSKFGTRCTGPGGFVNISQNTRRVYFMGTFTPAAWRRIFVTQACHPAGGQKQKIHSKRQQITFSGEYARKTGQQVTYVTERAVFRLTPDGLMLTEIAPGVDLQRDILDQMEFKL